MFDHSIVYYPSGLWEERLYSRPLGESSDYDPVTRALIGERVRRWYDHKRETIDIYLDRYIEDHYAPDVMEAESGGPTGLYEVGPIHGTRVPLRFGDTPDEHLRRVRIAALEAAREEYVADPAGSEYESRRRARARVSGLIKASIGEWTHFLTLTYDDEKSPIGLDYDRALETLQAWLKSVKKAAKKRGEDFAYLAVAELQEARGCWHWHLLVKASDELLGVVDVPGKRKIYKNILYWYQKHGFSLVEPLEGRELRSYMYLAKYVTKADYDVERGRYRRRYLASRGLPTPRDYEERDLTWGILADTPEESIRSTSEPIVVKEGGPVWKPLMMIRRDIWSLGRDRGCLTMSRGGDEADSYLTTPTLFAPKRSENCSFVL